MIKELFYLIKLLFTKQSTLLEIVTMKYFPFKGFSAMSWCGKIITRDEDVSITTKNHERIHLEQALFYGSWIKYYLVYLWWWIKGNPFSKAAYYTTPFEVEAYSKERDYDYQPTKDSWKKYIIKNRSKVYEYNKYYWRNYCKFL